MRKLWLLIGALAGLALLACEACAGAPTPIPLLPTSTRAPTSTPMAAAPTQVPLPTSEPAICTLSSHAPTPGPTEVSLFPGVSQADWKQGPDGAKVVFIEYSDFQ
jgi:hypothetical protein